MIDAKSAVTAYVDYCKTAGFKEANVITKTASMIDLISTDAPTSTVTVANLVGGVETCAVTTVVGASYGVKTVPGPGSMLGGWVWSSEMWRYMAGMVFVSLW